MDDVPARGRFDRFARWASRKAGHPAAFYVAFAVVLAWALTGPLFGFSDTWQLVINTATTIATFLMVFLIQNAQTRDSEAIHVKLDELIESTKGARRELLDLEELPEEELHRLQEGYEALAADARRKHHGRGRRSGRPTPGESSDAAAHEGGRAHARRRRGSTKQGKETRRERTKAAKP